MDFFLNIQNEIINLINEYEFNEESFKFLFYSISLSFIIVLFLGMTDIVVVYKNNNDFLWSMSVIIIPIISFIGLSILQPKEIPEDYDFFFFNIHHQIVSISGFFLTLLAILKMLFNTISNNGFLGGFFMFIFKLLAGFIIVIFIIGFLNALFKKDRSVRSLFLAMIVFGAFTFVLKKLINGTRVNNKIITP